MFNAFERMVAMRYLRSRRKEGFISVVACFSFLGIMLGVATLIVVMAVMNGFRTELMDRILGINAHITVSEYRRPVSDYEKLTDSIKNIDGVTNVTPVIRGEVLATANGKSRGAMVRGIKLADLKKKTLVSNNIIIGDLNDFTDGVIIGSEMSASMRLFAGDTIRLISPEVTPTFFGNMPRLKDYKIVGIFKVGMIEYDSSLIFMPLDMAQTYFRLTNNSTTACRDTPFSPTACGGGRGGCQPDVRCQISDVRNTSFDEISSESSGKSVKEHPPLPPVGEKEVSPQAVGEKRGLVTLLEVEVHDRDNIEVLSERIYTGLNKRYSISNWKQANSNFLNSLKVERNVMFLILTLIIIIAAFNIISGMVMMVTSKGKEIAILRTIGATRGSIMRIFFICGSSIGVLGTLFGFLLGTSFALNIETIRRWIEGLTDSELFSAEVYFLSTLPADVQTGDVTKVVIMALILSLLAPIFPAWRAAKTSPIDGLSS